MRYLSYDSTLKDPADRSIARFRRAAYVDWDQHAELALSEVRPKLTTYLLVVRTVASKNRQARPVYMGKGNMVLYYLLVPSSLLWCSFNA